MARCMPRRCYADLRGLRLFRPSLDTEGAPRRLSARPGRRPLVQAWPGADCRAVSAGGNRGRTLIPETPGGMPSGLGPGSLVAGYRLEERVGSGGMAVVFRALDERLGRRVAVKVLAPWVAADAAFRRRFIREARAAAAVDDPHIIPVYEADESRGVLFIAMRYVPGRDVGTLLAELGPLPPAR